MPKPSLQKISSGILGKKVFQFFLLDNGHLFTISEMLSVQIRGLVSLLNSISTFAGYFMPNPSFFKNSSCTI